MSDSLVPSGNDFATAQSQSNSRATTRRRVSTRAASFRGSSEYVTGKFNVGMTKAGTLLGLLSLAGILGSVVGGGLTDKPGRRKLILFGLVASALSALLFGSVNRRTSFFALFVIDAAISCAVAVLFYLFMPETRPAPDDAHHQDSRSSC